MIIYIYVYTYKICICICIGLCICIYINIYIYIHIIIYSTYKYVFGIRYFFLDLFLCLLLVDCKWMEMFSCNQPRDRTAIAVKYGPLSLIADQEWWWCCFLYIWVNCSDLNQRPHHRWWFILGESSPNLLTSGWWILIIYPETWA